MDRLERLLDIVHVLQTSATPVSLAELRDVFPDYAGANDESARRKFERDKAELAGIGIVLRYVSGEEDGDAGYVVDTEASYLPEIDLSAADRALLARAGSAALGGKGFPFPRALRLALGKLGVSASRLDAEAGAGVIVRHPAAELRAEESRLVTMIVDAIARRKRLAIEHEKRDGARSSREVDPYAVFCRAGAWYLFGHDHHREATRMFRLSGIRRATVNPKRPAEPDYAIPEGLDPRSYAVPPPHRFGMHEELEARVWVDPDVA
ncbi:MAG: WYL domain-containing protein, partial [Polyangiaceae bacterium]|nr:WYL domain-containing protein [Polyangiaceae bacterium]